MGIYAELRIPELWRCDGRNLTMWRLRPDGVYEPCDESLSFPGLRAADVERFIELGKTTGKLQWARELRAWVRNEFLPRRQGSTSSTDPLDGEFQSRGTAD
jgi:hypothetical protein